MGLSRVALWNALGLDVSVVAPMIMHGYEMESEREWREGRDHLTTSFYISNFPGDDPIACGRQAIYALMNIPQDKLIEPKGRSYMDAGKDIELNLVRRLYGIGSLLSGNEEVGESQTKLVDSTCWASGAVDSIVLPPYSTKALVAEIKTTSREKCEAMLSDKNQTPWSHSKYIRQLKTYIGYAHEQRFSPEVTVCEESWAITKAFPMGMRFCPVHRSFDCSTRTFQVEPPDEGELIYSARDEPLMIVSYHFSYDSEFLAAGREKLVEWRDYYLRGLLPPHPLEDQRKKWTADPCRFCNFAGHKERGGCKKDYAEKVVRIADSTAIPLAQKIRPQYDYEETRVAVLKRWETEDPLKREAFAA